MDFDFSFDDILNEFGAETESAQVNDAVRASATAVPPKNAQTPMEVKTDIGSAKNTAPEIKEPAESKRRIPKAEDSEVNARRYAAASAGKSRQATHPVSRPASAEMRQSRNTAAATAAKTRMQRQTSAPSGKRNAQLSPNERRRIEKEQEKRARLNAKDAERERKELEKQRRLEEKQRAKKIRRERARAFRRKALIALIVLCVILAAAAAGAFYAGIRVTNSDKVFPHVYMSGISLGGMTEEQAENELNSHGWDANNAVPLQVKTYGDTEIEIDPLTAGAGMPAAEAAKKAYSYGRDGNPLKNLFTYLDGYITNPDINEEMTTFNTAYIDGKIAECEEALNRFLGDEPYTVDREASTLIMRKGQGSMRLETAGLREAIEAALVKGERAVTYTTLIKEPVMPDLDGVFALLSAEPSDARYTDDGKFEIIDEVIGCWFDVAAAKQAWNDGRPGEAVVVPVQITYPTVTAEKLGSQLYRDLLGTMTTDYSASIDNRKSNVRLATSKIDGLIMYPGDEFSYNTVVGARTTEAGFLAAPAYSNGEVVDEIGGGACQVSSTLYSATLFADLEITDRTCHYFRVNYMQLGTDATVTIPAEGNAIDFCFKNNRNYPIRVKGYCEEGEDGRCTLTFEIWGTREKGEYAITDFNNSNQYGWENQWSREVEPVAAEGCIPVKVKLLTDLYGAYDEAINRQCTRTITYRIVTDLDGNELENKCVNKLLPSGTPAMDTYYVH